MEVSQKTGCVIPALPASWPVYMKAVDRNTFEIRANGHFSFQECHWYLNREFDDCTYRIYPDRVRKALRIGNEFLLIDILDGGGGLLVKILSGDSSERCIAYIRQYLTDWFDLETDVEHFYRQLSTSKPTSYMPERYKGLRLLSIPDFFESIAWCIIGQQINLRFAYSVKRRLVERYGTAVTYKGEKYHTFPTPETIVCADPLELREMQFSNSKAAYLIGVAKAFSDKTLNKQKLLSLPDFESRQKYLTAIKGIGVWTANYAMMKTLKERSCIPFGDAGLLNALVGHGVLKDKQDTARMEKFFRKFKGWESYLVFYLWRSLSPMEGEQVS